MTSALGSSQPSHRQLGEQSSNQFFTAQDDDWRDSYIGLASIKEAHRIDGWTNIIDVTLVYVALFSGVLTSFIGQISPRPEDVTNQLLIAIYRHQLDPSTPIDFETILKPDESKSKQTEFLSSLLYTSLAISVAVGAVAMAAKLWVIRYKREVNTSGPPHLRVRRRQEVYDGSIAWGLDKCIEGLPVIALISELLFGLFIFLYISEANKTLGFVVGIIFHLGLSFILVTSSTAAFNSISPFRSPFSDFVKFVFRIFPDEDNSSNRTTSPRVLSIVLTSVFVLAITGCLAFKQIPHGVPLIYFPFAAVLALAEEEEKETDIKPRLYNLPGCAFFTTSILFISCALAFYFSRNLPLFVVLYLLMCIFLGALGFVIVRTFRIKPKTGDADAIAWLLSSSLSQNPDWFKKAVQIAEDSSSLRARLLKALFPLFVPLITSANCKKDDEQKYVNCLADLVDFEHCDAAFWRNEAALEHPRLPLELRERLEALVRVPCLHRKPNVREAKWMDGTERCPERCVSDAAKHVLWRVLGKDIVMPNLRPTREVA